MTDAELLGAYASRQDEAAFGELMRRHGALVYRACHRLLKDTHEAEDASQAVFVVLARKAGGLTKGDLSAWLYRVAHLVAAEIVRKRMRRAGRETAYAVNETIQTDTGASEEVADPVLLGMVDAALLRLSEPCREAVILRYLKNHSLEEASRLAGCSINAMAVRTHRGIEQLHRQLSKRGMVASAIALTGLLTSEASAAVPETLLPSILAAVKTAVATTATATTATSTAAMLARGAMKAMFIAKVKMVVLVTATAIAVGGAGLTAYVAGAKEPARTVQTAGPAQDIKQEVDKLQGEWTMVSLEESGKKAQDDFVKTFKLTIQGEKWMVQCGDGKPGKATFKIDPSKNPKTIDLTFGFEDKEEVSPGIYKVDGDTLTLCRSTSGKAGRPTEFKIRDVQDVLVVWKRAKK